MTSSIGAGHLLSGPSINKTCGWIEQGAKAAHLPGVGLTQEAQLVSVAGPADHLAGYQNVQQTEPQEVQQQEDGRWVVGRPIKDGGFDEQEGHCDHCRNDGSVQVMPAAIGHLSLSCPARQETGRPSSSKRSVSMACFAVGFDPAVLLQAQVPSVPR